MMNANILVIDDTSDNLLLLGKVLTEQGYQVRRIREGNFALKIAKEEPPDLILLDIIMPSLNGYDICYQLKKDERTRHIPVIFLTVKGELIDKVKGFSIGAVDYITKPFEIEEVIARVNNQLKIASLQKQLTNQNARLRQEIKEKQRIEIQLTNSEKLNRSILNSAPVGICLTDADGKFLAVNPAYCKLYGFEENELIGQDFTIHFHHLAKQEKALLMKQYKQFINGNEEYAKGEFTACKKNGSQLFVDITRGVFQQDDKSFYVVTTVKDITSRKLTELALERELHRSKLLQQITEQIRSQWDTEQIFASAARQIGMAFNVSRCHILLYKPQPVAELLVLGDYVIPGYISLKNSAVPITNNPHAQQVLLQDKAIVSNNVYTNPLLKNARSICRDGQVKSLLAIRTSYQGEANGAIGLDQCDRYREWTPEEIELLEAIAIQLGIAIAQAQLLEQEKQARLELSRQNQALSLIVQGTAAQVGNNFFHSCTRYLAEVMQVQYALIAKLVDSNSTKSRTLAFWTGEIWVNNFEYDLRETPCEDIANGKKCFYSHNVQTLFPNDPYLIELNAESYLGIPLANSNGNVLGLLVLIDTKPIVLDSTKELILQIFAARASAELEQQNIKEALQESEHTLRAIFNCSFQFMAILQPNGILIGANQTALDFAGVEEKDIIGLPFWETPWWSLSQESRKQLKQAIKKAASGKLVRYEVDVVGAKDRVITIDFSIKPIYDQSGNLILLIPEGRDISDRKNSEKLLQQQSAAMAAATDGIAILDRQGKFIYLNDAYIKAFGYSNTAQLLGKNWQILYDEAELNRFDEEIIPILLKEGCIRIETKGIKRDGSTFPHEVTVTLLDTGERICIVRDIGERKRTEEALKESAEREKALAAAVQRIRQSLDLETIFSATTEELRQVIDCDRVVIYRFNPDWTGQFVAESIAVQSNSFSVMEDENKTLQIAVEKNLSDQCRLQVLLNSPNIWQDTYLKDNPNTNHQMLSNYLVVEDIYKANFSLCYLERLEQFKIRSYIIVPIFCGSQIWGLLAVYQHFNSRQWKEAEINIVSQIGNQLGVALQQSELLAQTKMQSEALQKAVLAADAANRAKSEFLASMSHELRTPLNAILGFTQVISFDNYLSQKHQENLDTINRAGEHLLTLINDILEMSKIEAGRTTLNQSSFRIIELLKSLEKMLELKAASKGLILLFKYSSGLPEFIYTDAGKLRQVLLNLLGNAIKFTEKGSVILRVKSQILKKYSSLTTHQHYRIMFEIEDTGTGIAPEEIRLLFEPFGQTETGKKSQQGTGLGLPISRKYVQMMGGDIKVNSTLNVGSLFTFDILASVPENVEEQLSIEEDKKIIGLASNQQKYRILIVEDTPDSQILMSKLLKPIGFEVKEASNGLEGLKLWEKWQPHLIFMDMRMPIMDGYEATKQIRAKESQRNLKKAKKSSKTNKTVIIALTASAFEEQRQMIFSVGCNDLIRKPFSVKLLLERISQYLGVQYLYEQNQEIVNSPEKIENINRLHLRNYLLQMPPEWIDQLYDAATECSDNMILELVEKIKSKNEVLSTTLANLAKNFLFETIIEIIEELNND
ncbi:MAG TPA: PAS domain S-box protein [Leptolyngbyaceae cyanobacterium]